MKNFMDNAIAVSSGINYQITGNIVCQVTNGADLTATCGLFIDACNNGSITGNIIGTDNTGDVLGIEDYGIMMLYNSNSNTIGGTSIGESNTIVNCGINGIRIFPICNYNRISGNLIYNNPKAIMLAPGANMDKTAPIITGFTGTTVTGTSQPGDIIQVFGSTGAENANEYLASVTADGAGNWMANITTGYGFVVATATDAQNNTSVLSYAQPITVLPVTKLSSEFCGVTNVVFDQLISAEPIAGATWFQFHVENIEMQFNEIFTTTNNSFRLIDLNRDFHGYKNTLK